MTDPGLTNRLRQHSRRAGLAIGLSMAMTIAVCLGGFVVIFAEVDPFLSDFIAAERATSTPVREQESSQAAPEQEEPAEGNTDPEPTAETQQDEQQEAPAPTPTTEPAPTPTSDSFEPDYQANSSQPINFRAGPGIEFDAPITLTPAQPLQYLNEDEPTDNPAADGDRWMKFRTEDGTEGWIREIDAELYQE
ncbi:MAG: hypothetical protein ACRDJH_22135 [Thermomicrobiales bacterium]